MKFNQTNIFISKEFQIIWREPDLWWKHSYSSAHTYTIVVSFSLFIIVFFPAGIFLFPYIQWSEEEKDLLVNRRLYAYGWTGWWRGGKKNGNSWVCARDQSEITTTTAAFKTRDIRAPTVEIRKKQQLCSRFSFSPFIVQCRRREKRGVFNSAQRYVRQGMRLMDAIKRSHGKWLVKKKQK